MLKDARGYLWIGTNDGLNRYDGYNFLTYRRKKGDSLSLSNNKVYALLEDNQGQLWVGTSIGLNRYDRVNSQFERYTSLETGNSGGKHNFIRSLYEDKQGRIWVGTIQGNLFYRPLGQQAFVKIDPPSSGQFPVINDIYSLLEDQNSHFWVASDAEGVFRLDRNTLTWEFLPIDGLQGLENRSKKVYEDKQGNIWVGTQGHGVFILRTGQQRFQPFTLENGGTPHHIVKDVIEDEDGLIWLGTDGGGITIFDPDNKKTTAIKYQANHEASLASNSVYSFYKDDQGVLWVGTFDGGVSIYNRNNKNFHTIGVRVGHGHGLSHRSVLCLLEDREHNIWIGTDGGGLNRMDPEGREFDYFVHEKGNPRSLSSNVVTALFEDSQNRIWIGTYTGGLQCWEQGQGVIATYQTASDNTSSLRNNNVWAIQEDRSGRLLIGTLGGLDIFDPSTGQFEHLFTAGRKAQDAYLERVTELYQDRSGRTWIGGKGVRYLDPGVGEIKPLAGPSGELLQDFDSRCFFEDSHNNFWIGTEGGGLFLLDRNTLELRNFRMADGLPSNAVHTLFEAGAGHLWMTTNKGLSKVNPFALLKDSQEPGQSLFRNYCRKDGLQSNQFSYNAGLKTHSGQLYFGGINGLNYFRPEQIVDNPYPPAIEITGLKIFDRYITPEDEDSPLSRPISEIQELTLTHRQSQLFSLEFTALNFTSSEKNQYAYKLEGFLDDWSYIGPRRSATFTNLNPGSYTFRVKAANNDGIWNDTGKSLRLTILPPFWKTNLAYTLYLLFALLLLLGFRHALLMRERLKNDLKIKELEKRKIEEVNQLKLSFFTNISHEFRTPLTLIAGPVDQMLHNVKLPGELKNQLHIVQRNTRRLLRLVNQLLEFRKIDDNKEELRPERRDLVRFVQSVKQAFDGLAESKQIRYALETNNEELWTMFDPDKLEKIIYNLLSNAFKFATNEVTIRIGEDAQKPGFIFISVQDDGAGIPKERQPYIFERFYQATQERDPNKSAHKAGTGIGLAFTKALVEMHGGYIHLQSQEQEGSCFTVNLPHKQIMQIPSTPKVNLEPQAFAFGKVAEEAFGLEAPVGETTLQTPASPGEQPLMLIVEDNPEVRAFIQLSFQSSYRVMEAENGVIGFQKAVKHLPDIIISDIMMPEKDGITLCRELKVDDRTSHIPLLLLTANTNEERWLQGLETGADDYVTKPFKIRFLKARISNLINTRKLLKRHFSRTILAPEEVALPSPDEAFINKAIAVIETHMSDSEFGVDQFARELGMSRSVLYRKFSALTDQSVKEFVNMIRMKRAAQLLKSLARMSVAEVAFSVGFSDPQYFSKKFKNFYHMTPTQYAEQHAKQTV